MRGQARCFTCRNRSFTKRIQRMGQNAKKKTEKDRKPLDLIKQNTRRYCNKCWEKIMGENSFTVYRDGSIRLVPEKGKGNEIERKNKEGEGAKSEQ